MPPRASEPYRTASAPLTTSILVLLFLSISGAWSAPHCCPVSRAPLLTSNIRFPYIPCITGLDTVPPVWIELTPLTRSSIVPNDCPNERSIVLLLSCELTVLLLTSLRTVETSTPSIR